DLKARLLRRLCFWLFVICSARAPPLITENWLADIHLRAFSNRCVAPASHLRKGVQMASSSCGWTGAEARYTIAQPRNATAKPRINTVVICRPLLFAVIAVVVVVRLGVWIFAPAQASAAASSATT